MSAMHLFLTGVGCVGKTTIGRILSKKLGIEFHGLDVHVEHYYGKSIERIQQECIGPTGYNDRYAEALEDLLEELDDKPSIIELPAGGLMYKCWFVVKKTQEITVALQDSPKNILNRITFFDIDSKPIEVALSDDDRKVYLKQIRRDIHYFKTGFQRADFQVDISGLTPEEAAERILTKLPTT